MKLVHLITKCIKSRLYIQYISLAKAGWNWMELNQIKSNRVKNCFMMSKQWPRGGIFKSSVTNYSLGTRYIQGPHPPKDVSKDLLLLHPSNWGSTLVFLSHFQNPHCTCRGYIEGEKVQWEGINYQYSPLNNESLRWAISAIYLKKKSDIHH